MLFKTVTYFILTVLSVSSECDPGCQQNIRVKRGKYYSSPPIRFYNHPPMAIPIKGPFSYTPPPFSTDSDSPYPGSRPYKVSKRPTPPNNDGLGDDDIANLVKYMSKQDLDKILEYAQGKDQSSKFKDIYSTNEYIRPYKRENKTPYKGNSHIKQEDSTSYKEDLVHFFNYISEPANTNFINTQETQNSQPARFKSQNIPVTQKTPNEMASFSSDQAYSNSYTLPSSPILNNYETEPMFIKVYDDESLRVNSQSETERYTPINYTPYNNQEKVKELAPYPVSNNPYFTVTNEEEKLPPPVTMRGEDYEASYTNNVPKVEKPESYDVQNFGELPLMEYNSKLHDVSSYHVPHYTVTQPKSSKPKAPSAPISFPSSASYSSSSSTLLKPSPAAGDILEPIYEPAPSKSAAAEQSDAHLKATKIWSYKSQGAAYTLHDDGSLSPERSRPKYG